MRASLVILAGFCLTAPLVAQDRVPDFMQHTQSASDALTGYTEKPYRPVRVGEVRAAGFLTEGEQLSFGMALGPTSPPQVRAGGQTAVTKLGSSFAIQPPEGGAYRVGDTLMIAMAVPGPGKGWGQAVIPTGLVVVTARTSRQTLTEVAAIYGTMRRGQVVLPVEPVGKLGEIEPVKTPAGPAGMIVGPIQPRELQMPGGLMITDLGRDDGMAIGDFVEIRRQAGPRINAADTIEELMATGQVLNVNSKSSTVRLINILSPDIPAGTAVVRTFTLP